MFGKIHIPDYDVEFDHVSENSDDSTVCVAVSLFNYARYITQCLDSISLQTHNNLNLIVVDDCSNKDNSADVTISWMRRHAQLFRRATVIRHRNNQGLAAARNTAFQFTNCDAVFVMDADNLIYPRAIEKLARYVLSGEYDAAYTQIEMFGEQVGIGYAEYWCKEFLVQGNHIDAMALVSKRAWEEASGYTHIEGGWEDYDFWCKFIDLGMKVMFVPQLLCRYRVHGTSMLRTETINHATSLVVDLTMRHPWLRIQ